MIALIVVLLAISWMATGREVQAKGAQEYSELREAVAPSGDGAGWGCLSIACCIAVFLLLIALI